MSLDTDRSTLSLERIEYLLTWMRAGGHLITGTSVDWDLLEYLHQLNEDADEGDETDYDECPEDDDICQYLQNSNDPLQSVLEITSSDLVFLEKQHQDKDTGQESHPDRKNNAGSSQETVEGEDEADDNYNDDQNNNEATIEIDLSIFRKIKDLRTFPIALSNASKKLTLSVEPRFYSINSNDENESRILLEDEIFLIQRSVGKGMITLVADLAMIENQLLRETDNAEILWYLVHSNEQAPRAIWLFHNNEMPSLLELMWKHGWAVMSSLMALLVFWLYQSLHRFGPLIPKQAIARRRLMEHIEASGQYFWKKKNKQILVDSTRQALNNRIGQLHPAWINSDELGKIDHLSEMLELPTEQVKYLLFNNTFKQDEDFTKLIIKLESIRRNL